MGWFWRAIDWLGRFQIVQAVTQYLWTILPIGWFVGTGVAGIMTGQPLMWIMVAVAASAAFICTAILMAMVTGIWLQAENKLRFVGINVGIDLAHQKTGNASKKIERTQVMVQLSNDAHFPMSVILENAKSSIDNKLPPRGDYPKKASPIGSRGIVFVADDPIDMNGRQCGNLIGDCDFVIKYGYPGQEKYTLSVKGTISVGMDSSGAIKGIWFNHSI